MIGVYGRLSLQSGTGLTQTISSLRSIGVQFSRENFDWNVLEPRPGQFNWLSTDTLVGAAARQGLQIIPILWSSPPWVESAWNVPPTSPAAMALYAGFVEAVVARYGSQGTFWAANPSIPRTPITYYDIWNEPYTPAFWAGGISPAAYAEMFKTAVTAGRLADPNAKFLLEANTSSFEPGAPPFLSAMFQAAPDLGNYAYALSVHPYANNGWGPDYCTRYSPSQGVQQDWRSTLYEVCRVEDERAILDSYGATGVRIWITEIGWSTQPGGANSVSEQQQADYVHQLFALLRGPWRSLIGAVQWYGYEDAPALTAGTQGGYGLVSATGAPKPAWSAFAQELAEGL